MSKVLKSKIIELEQLLITIEKEKNDAIASGAESEILLLIEKRFQHVRSSIVEKKTILIDIELGNF